MLVQSVISELLVANCIAGFLQARGVSILPSKEGSGRLCASQSSETVCATLDNLCVSRLVLSKAPRCIGTSAVVVLRAYMKMRVL